MLCHTVYQYVILCYIILWSRSSAAEAGHVPTKIRRLKPSGRFPTEIIFISQPYIARMCYITS